MVSFCFITCLFFVPYLFCLLTAVLFVNNSDCVLRNSAIRTIRYGVGFEPVQNHVCKAPPPPPPPRRSCYQPAARTDYKTTYYDNEMVSEGHGWPGRLWGEGARETNRQTDRLIDSLMFYLYRGRGPLQRGIQTRERERQIVNNLVFYAQSRERERERETDGQIELEPENFNTRV